MTTDKKPKLDASSFRAAFQRLGVAESVSKTVPADLEGVADSAARTLDLLDRLLAVAASGDRDGAATMLAEIEIEVLSHMQFHQRSLRRRIVAVQNKLNTGTEIPPLF